MSRQTPRSLREEPPPHGLPGVEVPPELRAELDRVVAQALGEDVGPGDLTTEALIDEEATCAAWIVLKEPGVACGLFAAEAVFRALDPEVRFAPLVPEGAELSATVPLARVEGSARALLAGERTALNLLERLCGIATLTRRYVDAIAGTGAVILDTRKTTPGLRALEKYAVRCGGGQNHRFGLYDAILVKDNHLRLTDGVAPAVRRALAAAPPGVQVEVEAETLDDVREVLDASAGHILLDNMPPVLMAQAVVLTAARAKLEASGGVTLENVRAIAETGVDFISVGALTHSARALDVSLDVL